MIRRGFLAWLLALGAVLYVLMSASIAISTADECDELSGGKKHWVLLPPQWECGPGDIQLTPDE